MNHNFLSLISSDIAEINNILEKPSVGRRRNPVVTCLNTFLSVWNTFLRLCRLVESMQVQLLVFPKRLNIFQKCSRSIDVDKGVFKATTSE